MRIHILGIAGTFMAGIALIAKALGHEVTGTDEQVYPPMSTALDEAGIGYYHGYHSHQFEDKPDFVIVGNAMSRGNPLVEIALAEQLEVISGPDWLYRNVLKHKHVLAVAGTHGKTTTSSMLAWILESAGLNPGYLIGGKPGNFSGTARLTDSPFFVIEADEYDTAFFDKRAKFVHYWPHTAIINNIEFDHADIYSDLSAIIKQFHHLIRLMPQGGKLLTPIDDPNCLKTLQHGVWCQQETLGTDKRADWSYQLETPEGADFTIYGPDSDAYRVQWALWGEHNVKNALAACAAACHVGVKPDVAIKALGSFRSSVKRMELKAQVAGIKIYEDFAHHPTAIETTLNGFRARFPDMRLVVLLELRSFTMKQGAHRESLPKALRLSDETFIYVPERSKAWCEETIFAGMTHQPMLLESISDLSGYAAQALRKNDCVIVMSNGDFGGVTAALTKQLQTQLA